MDNTDIERLVGKVEVYRTRLGKYRYFMIFKGQKYNGGKYIVITYTGKMVNNRLYGEYGGMSMDNVKGKAIPLTDVPAELIEDAIRGIK